MLCSVKSNDDRFRFGGRSVENRKTFRTTLSTYKSYSSPLPSKSPRSSGTWDERRNQRSRVMQKDGILVCMVSGLWLDVKNCISQRWFINNGSTKGIPWQPGMTTTTVVGCERKPLCVQPTPPLSPRLLLMGGLAVHRLLHYFLNICYWMARLFTVLYFPVRSSRSSALRYGLPSCMSVKTT